MENSNFEREIFTTVQKITLQHNNTWLCGYKTTGEMKELQKDIKNIYDDVSKKYMKVRNKGNFYHADLMYFLERMEKIDTFYDRFYQLEEEM